MNYLLRNVDPELWKAVKITAVRQDVSIRELIIALLIDLVRRDNTKTS